MGWGYGWPMGWFMIWWCPLAFGIVGIAVWVAARTVAGSRMAPSGESPETVLKRRYATGEIDKEEFERRLTDLRK
jgi:putative membrane protein